MPHRYRTILNHLPTLVFGVGVITLFTAWALWWALAEGLLPLHVLPLAPTSLVLEAVFGEAMFVERIQFAFVVAAALLSFGLVLLLRLRSRKNSVAQAKHNDEASSGESISIQQAHRAERSIGVGVLLLSAGLVWMHIEDVYNVRHITANYLVPLVYGDNAVRRNPVRIGTDLAMYTVLGSIMLIALWKLRPLVRRSAQARRYFLIGYSCYACAAVFSATSYIGDWYDHAGEALFPYLSAGMQEDVLGFYHVHWASTNHTVYFWIMDFAVEESLELLGASGLAAGILVVFLSVLGQGSLARQLPASRD